MDAGLLCGPPPALARHDLILVGAPFHLAHDDRLEQALLLHRGRQVGEILFGKVPARVARVLRQELDRHMPQCADILDQPLFGRVVAN